MRKTLSWLALAALLALAGSLLLERTVLGFLAEHLPAGQPPL